MWVPTAKSPALQSGPSSLGLFSIPSYEKDFFFSREIKSLQQKWAKCIELLGDQIKK